MIAEHKDSCTSVIKKVVTNDIPLTFDCDQNIIGQCSDDDIQACIGMLIKIDQPVTTSNTKGGGNMPGAYGIQGGGVVPTLVPTNTPTPTMTPTPTVFKNAFEILRERAEGTTPSASVSTTPTVASGSGTVYGISTSLKELDLQNFINSIRSLISIFK